jgi:hypothetical protein
VLKNIAFSVIVVSTMPEQSPDPEFYLNDELAVHRILDEIGSKEGMIRLEELDSYNDKILSVLANCMENQWDCPHITDPDKHPQPYDLIHMRPFAVVPLRQFRNGDVAANLDSSQGGIATLARDHVLARAQAKMVDQHALSGKDPGNVDYIYKGKVENRDIYLIVAQRQSQHLNDDGTVQLVHGLAMYGYRRPKEIPKGREWMFPAESNETRKTGRLLLRAVKAKIKPNPDQYHRHRRGFRVE